MSQNIKHSAVVAFAALCVYFHIHLIFTGLVPNLLSRPVHLALALPWVFVINSKGGGLKRWTGFAICVFGIWACSYVVLYREMLSDQYGFLTGPLQYVMGVGLLLVVLEMARRAVKWALPLVAVAALAYGLFGQHLPGEFGHAGIPTGSLLGTLTIAEGGLWGRSRAYP